MQTPTQAHVHLQAHIQAHTHTHTHTHTRTSVPTHPRVSTRLTQTNILKPQTENEQWKT